VDRPEGPKFDEVKEGDFLRVPTVLVDGVVREGKNFGLNKECFLFWEICHGTSISNALNVIPGANALATVHDTWMNKIDALNMGNTITDIINFATMPPALVLNYSALINQYYFQLKPAIDQSREDRK
jgi:filamentous hemagglutinin